MADLNAMLREYYRLRGEWEKATEAEVAARNAYSDHANALQREAIEQGGWKVGDELKNDKGEPRWISHVYLDRYKMEIVANCYRILKSGKRSASADISMVLKSLKELVH